ncbi:hypothetical protein ACH5RR_003233 [Cinchona calisaya]|uniref:Uncharacterized protein n=1 Tax=Cinchona calisaya TaxID=153742 RepID=A0ABD3AU73_9GENT
MGCNNNGIFIDFNEEFEFDEDNFSSNSEGFNDEGNNFDELSSNFEVVGNDVSEFAYNYKGQENDWLEIPSLVEDVMNMTFESEEKAGEFYNLYAKAARFSIRKCNRQYDNNGKTHYRNVGFVLKDLYNKMDIDMKREIAMGDVEDAIAYLTTKKNADKMFYYKYDTDGNGRSFDIAIACLRHNEMGAIL